MSEYAIKTKNLCKKYQMGQYSVDALTDINLVIPQGQFLSIMGKSGSGKSTLLHLIGGLDQQTSGSVWIGDQEISTMSENKMSLFRRKYLGFVFQFFNLIPELNLRENIIFPSLLENNSFDEKYFEELCTVLELKDRLSHLPSQVSGGQQQRAAIARALIMKPKAILLDEPTGNLDYSTSQSVLKLLRTLSDRWQQTVILVTHDHEAASFADCIVEIRDGKII
ncbi:MAG: ABC transporter ATP-binding protein [Clostridiaceae bacterium]|nr:ABC transporter ATP-binding protein [Clostridiaceae bacterium]